MVLSAFNDPTGHRDRWECLPLPVLKNDPSRDPDVTKRLFFSASGQGTAGLAEDYSFFVIDDTDGEPVLLVECDALGDRFLGCREAAVELTAIQPDHPRLEAARSLALKQLNLITAWAGCPCALLDIPADIPPPPSILTHLGNPKEWRVALMRLGWIDLDQEIPAIERGYRASTRQRIRWGQNNLRIRTHLDPDDNIPGLYGTITAQAGRSGGLEAEFLAQALRDEDVGAYVGFTQDGAPVAIVLTSRHGDTIYDMATAKIPHGNAPLSHALIHAAVLDAKERGYRRFHFGPLYEGGEFGAKLKSIAEFKSGFASSFERRLLIWMS